MYVDESGDCGLTSSPTNLFILAGLVIHELRWKPCLEELIRFRKSLKERFGLHLREEFHASKFITRPGDMLRIPRHKRLEMIRHYADFLDNLEGVNLFYVVVQKEGKESNYNVFEKAWTVLIQRFENTIKNRNFSGPLNPDEKGLIICDDTDNRKLMSLVRKMRKYNPIPNMRSFGAGYRNIPINYIIEDPFFRNSEHSYFIQSVDLAAYLLFQFIKPNNFMRKKGGNNYYKRFSKILCEHISTKYKGVVVL
ncbi:MAG: DUF3800 domain-containing protein [Chloroflexi bacterium]|nr:DUF3800 domain-containing protein [Chloroflexota bacterium]